MTTHPPSQGGGITQKLNDAPLSLFHYRAMLTAGMGFFTDAYDLFIIGVATSLIGEQWHLTPVQVGLLGSSTLVATLIGAFTFGFIADRVGRKTVYGIEAGIMALGALACAFAPNFAWLLVFRFILGIGIGGDYPVSGVIMSEYSNQKNRGQLVGLVFSMQALGLVIGPAVALTFLAAGIDHAIVWRLLLGLGALPALAVIYFRRTLPESPRYLSRMKGSSKAAAEAVHHYSQGVVSSETEQEERIQGGLLAFFKNPRNLLIILGTAGSWFLLDYAYYGNTISTPLVLQSVSAGSSLLQKTAWSLMIFAVAAAPGYVFAFSLIDKIGHKRLQWIGFVAMALCFGAIGLIPGLTQMVVPFLVLYGLSYFFTEFGPNVTTFIIPTEVFPINVRTTGHGIAAGIGKVGAFLGVFVFPMLNAQFGLNGTLLISAGCAVAGALLTLVLPEPAGRSIEEVSGEHRMYAKHTPTVSTEPRPA
ncbi:MAG TPA: MFS transporter [Candidatus Peribacteraceae bacterium]|nr:MFS transporter [Candidatus Peribacteraceae bacterium]